MTKRGDMTAGVKASVVTGSNVKHDNVKHANEYDVAVAVAVILMVMLVILFDCTVMIFLSR